MRPVNATTIVDSALRGTDPHLKLTVFTSGLNRCNCAFKWGWKKRAGFDANSGYPLEEPSKLLQRQDRLESHQSRVTFAQLAITNLVQHWKVVITEKSHRK